MTGRRALSDRQVGVLFLLPFVTVAAVFVVYPAAEAVRLAFYSRLPFRPVLTFVGLDNFRYLVADPTFWAAARQAVNATAPSGKVRSRGVRTKSRSAQNKIAELMRRTAASPARQGREVSRRCAGGFREALAI